MQYCGKNMVSLNLYLQRDEELILILQHIVVFPVQKGRFINVVPFYFDRAREDTTWEGPALRDATRDEILKMYEGWEPEVQALLEVRISTTHCLRQQTHIASQCMENPTHWAILTVKPVDTYADDGVILLGDAVR